MKPRLLWVIGFTILSLHPAQTQNLNALADSFLQAYPVPGLAVGLIKGNTVQMGVAGVENTQTGSPISPSSRFQLSSNAKALTATIAATLVKAGTLDWDAKLLEVIPELVPYAREEYKEVTLARLLSHRAGIQPFEEEESPEWRRLPKDLAKTKHPKMAFAQIALSLDPAENEGASHVYSNGGYILAGLMMERASGMSWEEILAVFGQKWGLEAKVGFPASNNSAGTYGHKKMRGKYRPVAPHEEDVAAYFGPAGNVSMSLQSLLRFVSSHLKGLMGQDNILEASTYEYLHYGLPDYGLGRYNGYIGETEKNFRYHGGSLGTFSSAVMLSADRDIGILILVNADNKQARKLREELRKYLWKRYGKG